MKDQKEKIGVLHFLVVELGNKLLTIITLESNMLEEVTHTILIKTNFYYHNHTLHGL